MNRWLIIVCLMVLALTGCGDGQSVGGEGKTTNIESKALIERMAWVENANIDLLVEQKLKTSKRFLAVESDGEVVIPGLAKDLCELVVTNGDYEVLAGMSEVVYNSRHAELRVKTRDFARAYNQKLIKMIKSNT
ncbi:MAG: hypothetical protein HUJ19_06495 [Kangiella sp.]|nr:hypothetical protein [Kangiella sp.]